MANEKIITLDNLTEYNNKISDKLTSINDRLSVVENNGGGAPITSNSKILWLGTSIPYGNITGENNNYPKMIGDMLGCTVYNNSRAGSLLAYLSPSPNWTTSAQVDAEFATAYCLSATHSEMETKYRSVLNTIRQRERLDSQWVEDWMNDFKSHSFESLIIPYINGTIADCDVVVIDHGFNDRDIIFNICSQYKNDEKDNISYWPASVVGTNIISYPVTDGNAGWYWLTHLGDDMYYDTFELMNAYWTILGFNKEGNAEHKLNYFVAMMYIVQQIWKVNPNIKIIIGNYFSKNHGFDNMSTFKTKYILEANKQIANYLGLQCVTPADYLGLRNRQLILPDGTSTTDMLRFCPDGVHPGSEPTGTSNRRIAEIYVNKLRGII